MKNISKHPYWTGLFLIAVLLGLSVIIFILLPSRQDQTEAFQLALETEAADQEGSYSETEVESEAEDKDEEALEPADEELEIVENETPAVKLSATEILENTQLIAHGMGAIEDITIPNCLEGFLAQYEAGTRVFEADLRLSRDAKVVLRHDWRGTMQDGIDYTNIPTRQQFVSEKIMGEYTALSFQDLLLLMTEYPDICIITDSKFTESDIFFIQFDSMLADAYELDMTELFDRIVVQIYSENMCTGLNNIYPFPHYIYTLYQDSSFIGTEETFRERAAYCAEHGIEGITMDNYWWSQPDHPAYAAIAEEYGLKVYVHTLNDVDTVKNYLAEGVSAVYTDFLKPEDLA